MKPPLLTSLAGIVALLFPALSAHSAPIAYWKEFNAGSTNSGMITDSPTLVGGTADNADIASTFNTQAANQQTK